jgi:hypothetical protein
MTSNRRIKLLLSLFWENVNKNNSRVFTYACEARKQSSDAIRGLGNAGEISQSCVEDGHQTQEQQQIGRASAESLPLPDAAAADALFMQTARAAEPAHSLGGWDLAVKRAAALAAAVAP